MPTKDFETYRCAVEYTLLSLHELLRPRGPGGLSLSREEQEHILGNIHRYQGEQE